MPESFTDEDRRALRLVVDKRRRLLERADVLLADRDRILEKGVRAGESLADLGRLAAVSGSAVAFAVRRYPRRDRKGNVRAR